MTGPFYIMLLSCDQLKRDLRKLADPKQAAVSRRFFKTGPGEYGEGDIFLGIKVPIQRQVAKNYLDLPLIDLSRLLHSSIHEHRLVALLVLCLKYRDDAADPTKSKQYYDFYIGHIKRINNWDLVDVSAPNIAGNYLRGKSRAPLFRMARSNDLWPRRIAMVATLAFIRDNDYSDALRIARILLHDKEDLIHKAGGWMLREIGKRDQAVEESFLKKYSREMPRTMLRYAIERFPEDKRRLYLDPKTIKKQ